MDQAQIDGDAILSVLEKSRERHPTQIIARVAERHKLTSDDLTGPNRHIHIAVARYEAMAEIRALHPTKGTPWIGKWFNRDHTTVLYGLRRHAGELPRQAKDARAKT